MLRCFCIEIYQFLMNYLSDGGRLLRGLASFGEKENRVGFMIEVENLVKKYGPVTAVKGISFTAHPGQVTGFLGPNGAGKTTTMRIITGYMPATEGTVTVAGHDVFAQPIEAKKRTGYLPETPPLYPEMTPASYVDFVARLKDVPREKRKAAVERALERCGLASVRGREIRQLSKGYRQRVGLAQAIVHEPQVLVLDEPTVGLDPIQIREIRALIADLSSTGNQTVILSTHILPEVEAICQRVVLIGRGRKVLDQPLAELMAGGVALEEVFTRVMNRHASDAPEKGAA